VYADEVVLDLTVDNRLDGNICINEMLVRAYLAVSSTDIPNDDPCADGTEQFWYGINAGALVARNPAATHLIFNRVTGLINSGHFIPGTTPVPPSGIRIGSPGGMLRSLGMESFFGSAWTRLNFLHPPTSNKASKAGNTHEGG